jgi:very-short-patch-repair endonuclease
MLTNMQTLVALIPIALRQAGMVSRQQLLEAGLSRASVDRLVATGTLVRERGALRVAGCPVDDHSKHWAAVLATSGVLSHRAAAACFGANLPSALIDVTVTHSDRPGYPSGVRVHRSRSLRRSHVIRDQHTPPITNPPRTLLDLAAPASRVTDEQLIGCIDTFEIANRMGRGWLQWFVEHEASHVPGRPRVVRLLREIGDSVESVAERELLTLLHKADLPPFLTQYPIYDGVRFVARVDIAWPAQRVALELDGYHYHHRPGAFGADRQRANEVQLSGWTVYRFTPRQVRTRADALVATIRRGLGAARPQVDPAAYDGSLSRV